VLFASKNRKTRTMFGWRNEASVRDSSRTGKGPLERLRAGLGLRLDRLILARWARSPGRYSLIATLRFEVRVGGEIGQAEAPDPESLLDAVFVQCITWEAIRRHRNALHEYARADSRIGGSA